MPLKKSYRTAQPAQPEAEAPGLGRRLGGAGVRLLYSLLSSPGGPFGAGVSGVGESIAQKVEGSPTSPGRIAVEAGIGTIPASALIRAGKFGASALRSGAIGGAGELGREIAGGEEISPGMVAAHTVGGGILGGLLGRMLGIPKVKAPAGKLYEIEPTIRPEIPYTKTIRGGEGFAEQMKATPSVVEAPITQRVPVTGMPAEASSRVGKIVAAEEKKKTALSDLFATALSKKNIRLDDAERIAREPKALTGELLRDQKMLAATEKWFARTRAAKAKAAEDAAAAEQIARAREELVPTEKVSESISAPILGGRERLTTSFKKAAKEGTKKAVGAAPKGGRVFIGEEAIPEPRGLTLQPEATRLPTPAPETVSPALPSVEEAFKQAAPLAKALGVKTARKPRAPRTTEEFNRRVQEIVPEEVPPTPAGFEQPGLGPMFQTAEGSTVSRGPAPALSDEEFLAAVRKPAAPAVTPPTPTEPLSFFKSPVDVVGQAYRGAKAAGDDVSSLARQQLGVSLQQEASRAGLPTQRAIGPEALAKFLGAEVSPDIARQLGRPASQVTPAAPVAAPLTAPRAPKVSGLDQTAKARAAALAKRKAPSAAPTTAPESIPAAADEASKLRLIDELEKSGNVSPEDLDFLKRLKKLGPSEKGAVLPEALMSLGTGTIGATIGAATTEDPLTGAVIGGAAGLAAPAALRMLMGRAVAADPTVDPDIRGVSDFFSSPEKGQEYLREVWEAFPQYLRFNYLVNPNLFNNVFSGPIGAGYVSALERAMAGDPRGMIMLKGMSPQNWAREFYQSFDEAQRLVGQFERAGGTNVGEVEGLGRRFLAGPGTIMTMGDVTTRRIAMKAGFSEAEARAMTLTSEPEFRLMRRIADFPRGSPVGQILLPFSRTLANIIEQGGLRTPGLGFLLQKMRGGKYAPTGVPDPFKLQVAKQATGTGAFAVGAGLGYIAPEDEPTYNKLAAGFASNIGGPAALLGGSGFAAGRALRAGKTPREAAYSAVQEGLQSVPLPTTAAPTDWAKFIFGMGPEENRHPIPRGAYPNIDPILESIKLLRGGTGQPTYQIPPPQTGGPIRLRRP